MNSSEDAGPTPCGVHTGSLQVIRQVQTIRADQPITSSLSRRSSPSNQRRRGAAAALLPRRDWLPPPDSAQRLGGRRSQALRQLWVQSTHSSSPAATMNTLTYTHAPGLHLFSALPPGRLKVFAMKHGVVGIRGIKSGLYLCMGGDGLAYGAVRRPKTRIPPPPCHSL